MNHREGERIKVDLPIVLSIGECHGIAARLRDLSFSGAAIRCGPGLPLQANTLIRIHLTINDHLTPTEFDVPGLVVRRNNNIAGIMFLQEMMPLMHRVRGCQQLPDALCRYQAARAWEPPWPRGEIATLSGS